MPLKPCAMGGAPGRGWIWIVGLWCSSEGQLFLLGHVPPPCCPALQPVSNGLKPADCELK